MREDQAEERRLTFFTDGLRRDACELVENHPAATRKQHSKKELGSETTLMLMISYKE